MRKMNRSSSTAQKKSTLVSVQQEQRIIGKIIGDRKGPIILVFAGMHGNEPAGVKALEQVFDILAHSNGFKGTFLGLKANIAALKRDVRYIDEDMNRIWFPSIIDKIDRCPPEDLHSNERVEIKEILDIIEREVSNKPEHPVIFIDLHSFSAEGCMFAITPRKDRNIKLLSGLHIPMIFGIEEALRGTALRYFQNQNYITFALEGGNHRNELTVYNNVAALLMLLQFTENISSSQIPDFEDYERHLRRHSQHLPKKLEFVYQHIIEPGDNFSMRPGYQNFEPVKKGEWLAEDKDGKILAQCNGYLIMPLYQKQGDDGFFIVQEGA